MGRMVVCRVDCKPVYISPLTGNPTLGKLWITCGGAKVCYALPILMKVAIQGELGSFSHEAAAKMLASASFVPCARSAEVFDRVEDGSATLAVLPIENSLAGSVAEHFDLLLTRDVSVHSEFHLRVRHNLIAPPGVSLQNVRRVFSHPVALDQCRDFFRSRPGVQAVPFYDTAGSVRHVVSEGWKDAAAIAAKQAATAIWRTGAACGN